MKDATTAPPTTGSLPFARGLGHESVRMGKRPNPVARITRVANEAGAGSVLPVLVLTIGIGILEFVSVASFFPLLGLIFGADTAAARFWPTWLLGDVTSEGSVRRLAIVVFFLLLFKVGLTAWSLRRTFRYSYNVQTGLGRRLLTEVLRGDYEHQLEINSAVQLKNVTVEVHLFTTNVLVPALAVCSNIVVIGAVLILVAMVAPAAASALVCLVVGVTFILYGLSQRRISSAGQRRQQRLSDLHRLAHEAISGIRTVRTHGWEDEFIDRYRRVGNDYASLNTRYQTAASVPPLIMELVMFGGFVVIVLLQVGSQRDVSAALPLVGLTAVAGFRLIPAARRLFFDLVTMRYYWPSLEVLEGELNQKRGAAAPARFNGEAPRLHEVLEVRDVSYAYPGHPLVLRDVSFDLPAGTCTALVGRTGAGKSTLVDVLVGLLRPTGGSITIDGTGLSEELFPRWLSRVGYVSQDIFLIDGSIRENVAFGMPISDASDERVLDALTRAQLGSVVDAAGGLDANVGDNGVRLSGGERQRMGIARAIFRDPDLLILDEATSALDPRTEQLMLKETLRSGPGFTALVVAHRLATVRACDRVMVLNAGRVEVCGTFDEVAARSPWFAAFVQRSELGGLDG